MAILYTTVLLDIHIFCQGGPQLSADERGAGVCAGADGPLCVPAGQHDGGGGGVGEAQPQVRPALRKEGIRPLVRVKFIDSARLSFSLS